MDDLSPWRSRKLLNLRCQKSVWKGCVQSPLPRMIGRSLHKLRTSWSGTLSRVWLACQGHLQRGGHLRSSWDGYWRSAWDSNFSNDLWTSVKIQQDAWPTFYIRRSTQGSSGMISQLKWSTPSASTWEALPLLHEEILTLDMKLFLEANVSLNKFLLEKPCSIAPTPSVWRVLCSTVSMFWRLVLSSCMLDLRSEVIEKHTDSIGCLGWYPIHSWNLLSGFDMLTFYHCVHHQKIIP